VAVSLTSLSLATALRAPGMLLQSASVQLQRASLCLGHAAPRSCPSPGAHLQWTLLGAHVEETRREPGAEAGAEAQGAPWDPSSGQGHALPLTLVLASPSATAAAPLGYPHPHPHPPERASQGQARGGSRGLGTAPRSTRGAVHLRWRRERRLLDLVPHPAEQHSQGTLPMDSSLQPGAEAPSIEASPSPGMGQAGAPGVAPTVTPSAAGARTVTVTPSVVAEDLVLDAELGLLALRYCARGPGTDVLQPWLLALKSGRVGREGGRVQDPRGPQERGQGAGSGGLGEGAGESGARGGGKSQGAEGGDGVVGGEPKDVGEEGTEPGEGPTLGMHSPSHPLPLPFPLPPPSARSPVSRGRAASPKCTPSRARPRESQCSSRPPSPTPLRTPPPPGALRSPHMDPTLGSTHPAGPEGPLPWLSWGAPWAPSCPGRAQQRTRLGRPRVHPWTLVPPCCCGAWEPGGAPACPATLRCGSSASRHGEKTAASTGTMTRMINTTTTTTTSSSITSSSTSTSTSSSGRGRRRKGALMQWAESAWLLLP